MNAAARESGLNDVIGRILQVGIALSAFFIVLGLVMMVAAPPSGTPTSLNGALAARFGGPNLSSSGWLSGIPAGNPLSELQLGMLVLLATPIVRVAASVVLFLRVGDRQYVGITVLVLAMLLVAIFVLGPAEA